MTNMPYTVTNSFEKFRGNIEPPAYERETATNRKNHLVLLLEKDFEILDSFATGSLPRYTAVKGHADLDIIVVLHYSKHVKDKAPSEVLKSIRDCLGHQYTNVRKNGQAVTLYYKTWPNVDVVPVSRTVNDDGSISHYNVPDMNTETWIASQPVRHSNGLVESNKSFGVEFKRIVKMIKWWNHQHSSYLQSYHIEVLALNILSGTFSNYPWEIYQFFEKAITLVSSSLWHNAGYVDYYLDSKKRNEAKSRLSTARDKSRKAWYKTTGDNDDHQDAIIIWRQIFGDKFPVYG